MRPIILWLLFLGVSSAVQSAEITPQKAEVAVKSTLSGDTRLERNVNLYGIGVSLAELLERLQSLTGAHITADTALAEYPLTIMVTHRSAASILASLAAGFDFRLHVRRNPKKPEAPDYTVTRSQSNREIEQRLRERDVKAFREHISQWAEIVNTDGPVDLRNYPDFYDSPDLTTGNGLGADRIGMLMFGLSDDLQKSLYQGNRLRLGLSDIAPSIRLKLSEFLITLAGQMTRSTPRSDEDRESPPYPDTLLHKVRFTLWIDTDLPVPERCLHVRISDIDLAPAIDSGLLASWPTRYLSHEVSFGGVGPAFETRSVTQASLNRAMESLNAGPPSVPSLDTKIDALEDLLAQDKPSAASFEPDGLLYYELHRLSGVPILSDYRLIARPPLPSLSEHTLRAALGWIIASRDAEWKSIQGIQTFRSRQWFMNDALSLSPKQLRDWRSRAVREKNYSVPLLTEMARLTTPQLIRVLAYGIFDNLYPRLLDPKERACFRLWGSLTPEQQQKASGEEGLLLGTLSDAQKGRPLDDLSEADAALLDDDHTLHVQAADEQLTLIFYRKGTVVDSVVLKPQPYNGKPVLEKLSDGKWFVSLPPPDRTPIRKDAP